MIRKLLGATLLLLFLNVPATAGENITVEVLNFSDMDRWVRVTDKVCGTVLWEDNLDAQRRLPVELCTNEGGKGTVELYIRIGCSKNKTILKAGVEDGATVQF